MSLEWFLNHPALRYGGYYLLCIIWFIPLSIYLSKKKFSFIDKKKVTISLIIFSLLVFNLRNIKRIDKEFLRVTENNFPLFFAPIQTSKEFIFADDIKVYLPTGKYGGTGCWIVKTPCVNGVNDVYAKKKYGFKIFYRKK